MHERELRRADLKSDICPIYRNTFDLQATCGEGHIHDGGADYPIMTCHECGHKSCFSCELPWWVSSTWSPSKGLCEQPNNIIDQA